MAKTKVSERVPGSYALQAKKKRRSSTSVKHDESDSEAEQITQVKRTKRTPAKVESVLPQSSKTTTSTIPTTTTTTTTMGSTSTVSDQRPGNASSTRQALGGDNLTLLKERFNHLHDVRFTEPEKQCNELLKLLEEQKTAHEDYARKLEQRISTLEHQTKDFAVLRRRERELLDENVTVKSEVESVRKSLQLADQERSALLKALETVDESPKDSAAIEQMVVLLDLFKALTGVTIKLEDDDLTHGSCTIYNQKVKKGVRLSLTLSGSKIILTPVVNKNLLPPEMRNKPAEMQKEEVPAFIARILGILFN